MLLKVTWASPSARRMVRVMPPRTIDEVDTAHFKGNYPDRCLLQAAREEEGTDQSLVTQSMFWPVLLPEQSLQMDSLHTFSEGLAPLGPVSHVRFNIIPDGGVLRLRLWGRVV